MKNKRKLLIYGILGIAGIIILVIFQSNVIKVSANTDNTFLLKISPPEIAFGTVFPGENLKKQFTISLNDDFGQQGVGDRVVYRLKEKATDGAPPNLCDYISEKVDGVTADSIRPEFLTLGTDESDTIEVELTVPCFLGMCNLGYNGPKLDLAQQGQIFGCELWAEVSDVFYVDELAGMWHFDEGSGSIAYDSSSNGNNGTVNGAVWLDGKLNKALSFDGTDDYVQIASSSSLNTSSFSYEFWLYNTGQTCQTAGRLCRIISKTSDTFETAVARAGGSPGFLENHLYIYTGSAWLDTGYTVPLNQWRHIVITFDSGTHTLKAYADGVEVYVNSGVTISQSGELSIGRRVNGAGENYKGIIDEVRLYNRALSSGEIY